MSSIGLKLTFQKNEVANSYNMELEALKRGVEWMEQMDLELGTIITDRHVQVRAWIRDNLSDVKHYFDVWHISKGTYWFYGFISSLFNYEEFTLNRCL